MHQVQRKKQNNEIYNVKTDTDKKAWTS